MSKSIITSKTQPIVTNEVEGDFLKQVQAQEQQQLQLEMLTEECQQLIQKIFSTSIQVQQSILNEDHEDERSILSRKQDKSRLQNQFADLCIEIQRQQKQLDNYKFKIRVANKQAEYYSRQIKQKEQILKNLQKHQEQHTTRRKSFRR